MGIQSSREVGISRQSPAPASLVESYLAPIEMTIEGQKVDEGSWIIGIKVDSGGSEQKGIVI